MSLRACTIARGFLVCSPDMVLNIRTDTAEQMLQVHIRPFPVQTQSYKTFFMLNSAEQEIVNAHKYKNIKKIRFFLQA